MKQKIYISTIKDFGEYPKSGDYTVVTGEGVEITPDLEIVREPFNPIQHCLNEYSRMFYVRENVELPDYVGFCSYRRYFDFYDEVPDLDYIFSKVDIVLPYPLRFDGSIMRQYALWHNSKDLVEFAQILMELYPDYDVTETLKSNMLYPNGLFIMKKDDFCDYIDWIKPIWETFADRHNLRTDAEVQEYVMNNMNAGCYLNVYSSIDYQSRLFGFIAERLLTIYVRHNFNRIKHYKIKRTNG